MSFPILFARSETNSVLTWQIIVDGDSFHTISGQQGGKLIRNLPTKCFGKNSGKANETSSEAQAQKEAKAKWDKKIKSGGYSESVEDIDKEKYIAPMLAKIYSDYADEIKFPVLVQSKFNGSRCIATKQGLFTRKGERYVSIPHIEESLQSFFESNPAAVLDGELFCNDYREKLNETMKLVRKTVHITPKDLEESRRLIEYFVYDGYSFNDTTQSTPYSIRKFYLDNIAKEYSHLKEVETFVCKTEAELMVCYDGFISDAQEGAIIRFADSPYENKRSKLLLKIKPTDDAEFLVTDIQSGEGNWQGCAKIVSCVMDDGRTFNATFKGTMEQAREVLISKEKYLGAKYTVFYNGFTGKGIPNYAQFDYNNSLNQK